MDEFLIAMLAAAGATLTGRSLLFLFDRVCGTVATRRPAAEIWGTSILLGVSFTAASGFVWCDMGQELGPHFSWRQVIIGGLLGILAEYRSRRLAANSPPLPVVSSSTAQIQIIWIYRIVACAVILGMVVLTLRDMSPAYGVRRTIEDKARVLFEARTTYTPELIHPEVVTPSSRDPLLIPLFERHVYALLGRECQPWAQIWAPLTYAGMLLTFIGIVGRRVHPTRAWGGILAVSPYVLFDSSTYQLNFAVPTLAAVCFHTVAVLYLWDAWQTSCERERVRGILLASGMASSVCFIRNDGVALLLLNTITWWATAVFLHLRANPQSVSSSRHLMGVIYFCLFAAFLLTPWMRYRSELPIAEQIMITVGQNTAADSEAESGYVVFSCFPLLMFWVLFGFVSWMKARSHDDSGWFLVASVSWSVAGLLALQHIAPSLLTTTLGVINSHSYVPLMPVIWLLKTVGDSSSRVGVDPTLS